jgi:hypothetical protein
VEGQRWHSTLVDLAFFATVCLLGFKLVLHETVLATLLGMYAAGRFGVAHGKQQAVIALSGGGNSNPPGPPGSGSSGEHRLNLSQSPPPPSKKVDPRTMRDAQNAIEARLACLGFWG